MNEISNFLTIDGLDNITRRYTIIRDKGNKWEVRVIENGTNNIIEDILVDKKDTRLEVMSLNNKYYKELENGNN